MIAQRNWWIAGSGLVVALSGNGALVFELKQVGLAVFLSYGNLEGPTA